MPTYHYRCKSCKHEFEELQRISENPLVVCPSCKKHSLARMISGGSGLVFKGSGFYITDYKSKSDKPHHHKKETKSGEISETKSEVKSKSKTESKVDTKSSDSSKTSGDSTEKE